MAGALGNAKRCTVGYLASGARLFQNEAMRVLPVIFAVATLTVSAMAAPVTVYVGTYTNPGGSAGIYRTSLDTETGALTEPVLAAEATSPSFLALTPDGKTLLAVAEGAKGVLLSYAVKPDGSLEFINRQPAGDGPCHLEVSPKGDYVAVANYGGGSVVVFPLNAKGELGPASDTRQHTGSSVNPARQEKPHAHGIHFFPTGNRFMAPDLGTDRVEIYEIDKDGRLQGGGPRGIVVPPGSGPRHCAISKSGDTAWVVNELSCTVNQLRSTSRWTWQVGPSVSTLPEGWKGENSCAEILLHPGGKFLVATNRGHNSIARFEIESNGGMQFLGTTPTFGEIPRGASFSPDGRQLLVANQKTGNLVPFSVHAGTGQLEQSGAPVNVSKAVCVLFAPAK